MAENMPVAAGRVVCLKRTRAHKTSAETFKLVLIVNLISIKSAMNLNSICKINLANADLANKLTHVIIVWKMLNKTAGYHRPIFRSPVLLEMLFKRMKKFFFEKNAPHVFSVSKIENFLIFQKTHQLRCKRHFYEIISIGIRQQICHF